MFSSIIESVLVKHLGKYVDGIKNNMDVGLFDGQVKIQNVSLKTAFFNQLNLPISLKFSHIDKIQISIPWTSLKDKPVVVAIKGIYLLFAMSYQHEQQYYDPRERLKSIVQRVKLQIKKKFQESKNEQSFAQKSITRIIDNLTLTVNNIHIRIESIQRNWDFSIGIVMDNLSSYTINQNGQKYFFQRSFSNKQKNPPLRKTFQMNRFQIYFNEDQTFFMSWNLQKGKNYMIKLMSHPFKKQQGLYSKQRRASLVHKSSQSFPSSQDIQQYKMKILTKIAMQILIQQKTSPDFKYVIDIKVNFNKIDVLTTDRQIGLFFYSLQHIYEWVLNQIKNGKKNYNQTPEMIQFYKNCLLKMAKDDKVSLKQSQQMLQIVSQWPLDILQEKADDLIQATRIQKQVKKISKVSNVQKSKKMMQELLTKVQKEQVGDIIDIIKQINVNIKIGQIKNQWFIGNDKKILDIGFFSLDIGVNILIGGSSLISMWIDDIILKDPETTLCTTPGNHQKFLDLSMQVNPKDGLKKIQLKISKRKIQLQEKNLIQIIQWINEIKLRPPIINFLNQQLNYSIDITKILMEFLFCPTRQIVMNINIPILQIDLNKKIFINPGKLIGQHIINNSFRLIFAEDQKLQIDGVQVVTIKAGTMINLLNKITSQTRNKFINNQQGLNFKQVQKGQICVESIEVSNLQKPIEFILQNMNLSLIQHVYRINAFEHISLQLQGYFYLNNIKSRQRMILKQSKVVFLPSRQEVSLLRTKIYEMEYKGKFYIVFRQQVQKEINVVLTQNQKTTHTIYLKLKQYIHQICTPFQWEKYFKKPYPQKIANIQQIQAAVGDNTQLMHLEVNFKSLKIKLNQFVKQDFDSPNDQFLMEIQQVVQNSADLQIYNASIGIVYNLLNTQSSINIKAINFLLDKQKVIYDMGIQASYKYLQYMQVRLLIKKLGLNIKKCKTLSKLLSLSSYISFQGKKIAKKQKQLNFKKKIQNIIQENQQKLNQSNSIFLDNSNSKMVSNYYIRDRQSFELSWNQTFLLQKKIIIETQKIESNILGYQTSLDYFTFALQTYRNQKNPQVLLSLKSLLLFSMIKLPLMQISIFPNEQNKSNIDVKVTIQQIIVNAHIDILINDLLRGQASVLLQNINNILAQRNMLKQKQKSTTQKCKEEQKVLQNLDLSPIKMKKTHQIQNQNIQESDFITEKKQNKETIEVQVEEQIKQSRQVNLTLFLNSLDVMFTVTENLTFGFSLSPFNFQKNVIKIYNLKVWVNQKSISIVPLSGIIKLINRRKKQEASFYDKLLQDQSEIDILFSALKIAVSKKQLIGVMKQVQKALNYLQDDRLQEKLKPLIKNYQQGRILSKKQTLSKDEIKSLHQQKQTKIFNGKFSLRIQEFQIMYSKSQHHPLISIKSQQSIQFTNVLNVNTLKLQIVHFNNNIKLFQPVLEPIQIYLINKSIGQEKQIDFNHLEIQIQEIRLCVSYECLYDILDQVNIITAYLQEFNQIPKSKETTNITYNQIEKQKKLLQNAQFQKYDDLSFSQSLISQVQIKNSEKLLNSRQLFMNSTKGQFYSALKLVNNLNIQLLAELLIKKDQKQVIHFKNESEHNWSVLKNQQKNRQKQDYEKSLKRRLSKGSFSEKHKQRCSQYNNSATVIIQQKTHYFHSYELLQKYKKISLKFSFVSPMYSMSCQHFRFSLYNSYPYTLKICKITTDSGEQFRTTIGVHVQYSKGNYIVQIVPKYILQNDCEINLNLSYRDQWSVNKTVLKKKQKVFLPFWINDCFCLGVNSKDYSYIIELKPKNQKQRAVQFQIKMNLQTKKKTLSSLLYGQQSQKNINQNQEQKLQDSQKKQENLQNQKKDKQIFVPLLIKKLQIIGNKEQSIQQALQTQKKVKEQGKPKENDKIKTSGSSSQQQIVFQQAKCFHYKIMPLYIVKSHLNFPITVNDEIFFINNPKPLYKCYEDNIKIQGNAQTKTKKKNQYDKVLLISDDIQNIPEQQTLSTHFIELQLNDGSKHQVYIPPVNKILEIQFKLSNQQYVTVFIQTRKNCDHQKVIHIYCTLQLILNFPHIIQPKIKTNIYGNTFLVNRRIYQNHRILKRQTNPNDFDFQQNNDQMYGLDDFHPSPKMKDKFTFSVYHYIFTTFQRYITVHIKDVESNQIILYHSDFDQDLILPSYNSLEPLPMNQVYCVSYQKQNIRLESALGEPQNLECCYVYVMPKYYLVNLTKSLIGVQGLSSSILRYMDKVILPHNEQITFILHKYQQNQEQYFQIGAKISQKNYLFFIKNASLRNAAIVYESEDEDDEENQDTSQQIKKQQSFKTNSLNMSKSGRNQVKQIIVNIEDMKMFQLNSELGGYNTHVYEISDWVQWMEFNNSLQNTIIIRSKLFYPKNAGTQQNKQGKNNSLQKIKQTLFSFTYPQTFLDKVSTLMKQNKDTSNIVQMSEGLNSSSQNTDLNLREQVTSIRTEMKTQNQSTNFSEYIVIQTKILPKSKGSHIYGIVGQVQVSVDLGDQELIIGQFQLNLRLNHSIYPNKIKRNKNKAKKKNQDAQSQFSAVDMSLIDDIHQQNQQTYYSRYKEISLKQIKVDKGRSVNITCVLTEQSKNYIKQTVHKVSESISLKINKFYISLVLLQDLSRKQFLRLNLSNIQLIFLKYKNGLYMLQSELESFHVISKTKPIIRAKDIKCYIEGFTKQFVERIAVSIGDSVLIVLTDDFILSVAQIADKLKKSLPFINKVANGIIPNQKLQSAIAHKSQEFIYPINTLQISPINLKLSIKKTLHQKQLTETKLKLLEKFSLSIIQIQESEVNLSKVHILEPLREAHFSGMQKMYVMEIVVGLVGGMNIIGNPKQFVRQIQAGRKRGGVLPFFSSIVAGTSNSISKILNTVGNGLSELTFDYQYQKSRLQHKNQQVTSFAMGLKFGLLSCAQGFKSGFMGVVQQPMHYQRIQGGFGILKGSIYGITGLVTKPITGIIDLTSKTIQGIKNSTSYSMKIQQQLHDYMTRPLYHRLRLLRFHNSEDELAYNIMYKWYQEENIEIVSAFLLQNQQGNQLIQLLIITCTDIILIDLQRNQITLRLYIKQLMATGKFAQGVVLYFKNPITLQSQQNQESFEQDQIVFRLKNNQQKKNELYMTLKTFISLYAQQII